MQVSQNNTLYYNYSMQKIITLDLEGVLIPEIWQLISKATQIPTLGLTTRDIADYDTLMNMRIKSLSQHNINLKDIQDILSSVRPLEGALIFLERLKEKVEVMLISDTFIEFFQPLRKSLGYPAIFCNSLEIDDNTNMIMLHKMRIKTKNGKKATVEALQSINCIVAAAGDSYNDLYMLQTADYGAWFRPPESIKTEYSTMPVFDDYDDLAEALLGALE